MYLYRPIHMSSIPRPLDKRAKLKIIFLFLNQNICCGFSMRRFFCAPKQCLFKPTV